MESNSELNIESNLELNSELNLLKIDKIVTIENLKNDIFDIYSQLFPNSKIDDLNFDELSGGYINSIVKIKSTKNKSVIFRTFDLKFNVDDFLGDNDQEENFSIFDRKSEFYIMNKLSKHNICEKVHCEYSNGIVYDFAEGKTIDSDEMLTDEFLELMPLELAKLHSINLDLGKTKFNTHFDKMMKAGESMKSMQNKLDQCLKTVNEYPYVNFPNTNYLKNEENKILDKLNKIGYGEIRLAHNDLNFNNIIYNPKLENKIRIIDFELISNNYIIMEFGYLFINYSGHFLKGFNRNKFPTNQYRLKFLENYLNERIRLKTLDSLEFYTNNDLNLLFIRTNLSILYHAISIIQEMSLFDFNKEIRNDEMDKILEKDRYYFGKVALSILKIYEQIKDEFFNLADDYLKINI